MFKPGNHGKLYILIRTLIITYLITAFLLLGLAFIAYKSPINIKQINLGLHSVYVVAGIAGGFILAKTFKNKRMLWGIVFGLAYFAVLFAISMLINHQICNGLSHAFLVLGLCVLGGILGSAIS